MRDWLDSRSNHSSTSFSQLGTWSRSKNVFLGHGPEPKLFQSPDDSNEKFFSIVVRAAFAYRIFFYLEFTIDGKRSGKNFLLTKVLDRSD